MKSLKSLVESGVLSFEEKTDLLLSLIEHIDVGYEIPVSLSRYSVRDNGTIAFTDGDSDISLASPELFTQRDVPSRERQWFTLGLVGYYIFYGKTYYEEKGCLPIDMLFFASDGSEGLIQDDLFDGMFRVLTSWNPSIREQGIARFFGFLREKYISRLRVDYFCGSNIIFSETMNINGVIAEHPAKDVIRGNDGRDYKVNEKIFIPFRLVPKKYRINVSPLYSEEKKPSVPASLMLDIDELIAIRKRRFEKEEEAAKKADNEGQLNPQLEFIT